VALNAELAAELKAAGIARVVTIPNGVDLQTFTVPSDEERRFARRQVGVPDDRPVVLYAGRLVPEKGVDDVLAAWPGVVAAAGEEPSLLVAGGGAVEDYRARAAGLTRVRILGKVDGIRPLLHAASLVVLPSRSEGLSNVVLEAMACGVPVVGTAIPGLADQIRDGQTGVLVPVGDVAALAAAIVSLLADTRKAEAMGTAARADAVARFSLDSVADRYQELYRQVSSGAAS
jgi:glycosyltransferase involved in cell wall biosynthesis